MQGVAGLRRAAKNIAHNYTDPQKKVREATSNDPWGPSSTIMSEIADLTYNIEAFAQIMEMLWKRLNDSGKNWRHVYKSLVLLEYLIKTGSERVGQQCKENIFAIQTLKDFQHLEDNKDQGLNVREKAKQLVALLTSEERLRNERARALKARERFAQTVNAFGSSDSNEPSPTSPVMHSHGFGHGSESRNNLGHRLPRNPEIENARPQTQGEEELQLQLALAMSKEEAEEEEQRRKNDDLRLQLALSQSEQEFKTTPTQAAPPPPKKKENTSSAILDLLDVDLGGASALPPMNGVNNLGGGDIWGMPGSHHPPRNQDVWNISAPSSTINSPEDAWKAPSHNLNLNGAEDPWMVKPVTTKDPWISTTGNNGTRATPTSPFVPEEDEFDILSKRMDTNLDTNQGTLLTPITNGRSNTTSPTQSFAKKTPTQFLGENSGLVDLDNLLQKSASTTPVFGNSSASALSTTSSESHSGLSLLSTGGSGNQNVNPFHIQNNVLKPSINEIREKQQLQHIHNGQNGLNLNTAAAATAPQNNPWSPVRNENPFQ